MNYLAHAYLSFNNAPHIVGNMIADYVKGKQTENFPSEIREGIVIHRAIDSFTDSHPIVKETKLIFRSTAGRYDAPFLDIVYDYCLANNNNYCPQEGWLAFSSEVYKIIDRHSPILPPDFLRTYQHMKNENWLYNYQYKKTIKRNIINFANHLKYLPKKDHSDIYSAFENNIDEINKSFDLFFPQLHEHILSLYPID